MGRQRSPWYSRSCTTTKVQLFDGLLDESASVHACGMENDIWENFTYHSSTEQNSGISSRSFVDWLGLVINWLRMSMWSWAEDQWSVACAWLWEMDTEWWLKSWIDVLGNKHLCFIEVWLQESFTVNIDLWRAECLARLLIFSIYIRFFFRFFLFE